jgi:hypothetical protein
VNRFAAKAIGIDMNIRGNDDSVSIGDVLGAERLFGSERTLGLDFNFVTAQGRGAFQGFGSHEGMGNSGRAGGDSNESFHDLK